MTTYGGYLNVDNYLSTYGYLTTNSGLEDIGMQINVINRKELQTGMQVTGSFDRVGLQARGIISDSEARGMQVTGIIQNEIQTGVQFFSQTSLEDQRGMQFKGFTGDELNTGLQAQGVIGKGTTYGMQAQGIISKQQSHGSQISITNTKENTQGMQVTVGPFLHVPCGDGLYLSTYAYLSRNPYLVNQYCVFAGSQFQSIVGSLDRRGTQFRAFIDKQTTYGMQTRGIITDDRQDGLQFRAIARADNFTGAQIQGIITDATSYGMQLRGIITDSAQFGMQFAVLTAERYGTQFRVILYNTTQLRILCDFASRGDGTSWTVTNGGQAASSSDSFNVNNLNTDIVEQVYRSTTSSNVQLVCDTNIPQGVFVDTLGILNHNITRGATVTFEGSNSPTFTTSESFSVPVTTTNAYWIAPTAPQTAYRYWRINIQDSSNPSGYIEIGTIVFGSAEIFNLQENFTDRVQFGQKHYVDKVFTEGQTNVSNDRGKKKNLTLEFRSLQYEKQNWNVLANMFSQYGVSHKCLWIPTPTIPQRFALFGKLNEIPQESHNYKADNADYVDVTVTVDESL